MKIVVILSPKCHTNIIIIHSDSQSELNEPLNIIKNRDLEFGNIPDFIDRLTISIGDHDLGESSETKNLIRHISKVSQKRLKFVKK